MLSDVSFLLTLNRWWFSWRNNYTESQKNCQGLFFHVKKYWNFSQIFFNANYVEFKKVQWGKNKIKLRISQSTKIKQTLNFSIAYFQFKKIFTQHKIYELLKRIMNKSVAWWNADETQNYFSCFRRLDLVSKISDEFSTSLWRKKIRLNRLQSMWLCWTPVASIKIGMWTSVYIKFLVQSRMMLENVVRSRTNVNYFVWTFKGLRKCHRCLKLSFISKNLLRSIFETSRKKVIHPALFKFPWKTTQSSTAYLHEKYNSECSNFFFRKRKYFK